MNTRINIAGLTKEEVIIALFKNVYQKSAAAKATWLKMADELYSGSRSAPVGMDRAPDVYDVKQMLSQSSFIDYIGPVRFQMYFNNDQIDSTIYDREHATENTAGILTAEKCIEQLKMSKGLISSSEEKKSSPQLSLHQSVSKLSAPSSDVKNVKIDSTKTPIEEFITQLEKHSKSSAFYKAGLNLQEKAKSILMTMKQLVRFGALLP